MGAIQYNKKLWGQLNTKEEVALHTITNENKTTHLHGGTHGFSKKLWHSKKIPISTASSEQDWTSYTEYRFRIVE